jgi:hypothetical protein
MRSSRHMKLALALALLGLMTLVGTVTVQLAMGQGGTNTAAIREYESRLRKIDQNKPDELMGLAKWCYS